MSDQNPTTPDPSDAVPGYEPPAASEPTAPAGPPAYTPPAAPEPPAYTPPPAGGYEPPAATPPAYTPPPAGGYEPPAATPPAYTPPPAGGYEPPAATPPAYTPPPAGGYPPPPSAGFPEPPGPGSYPPPASGYTDPNAAYGGYPVAMPPVGGALVDWPKRALGGLVDYVAAGIVLSIVASVLNNVSSTLGTLVNAVLGIAWMCYLGYKSGTTGVTFGRSIAKTKLVSAETGQPIGVTNGIIRQFAHIIDSIICYVGWLFPLWDAKKQTIADKIMKTVVVDNSTDPNAGTYNWG